MTSSIDVALAAALDRAVQPDRLVDDVVQLIQVPSLSGDEATAQRVVADLAERLDLSAELHEEDLRALRDASDYPGEEAERSRLVNTTVTATGADPTAPRLCLAGHVDVVPAGERPWTTDPFAPTVRAGRIHGRGAADMKAGLVASLHGLAAAVTVLGQLPGDVVVHSAAAEEDGGLGAFALLGRDRAFAGCVIAEPTSGEVVCAHGGALTWRGVVTGVSAHACNRLDGVSALDRFLPVYAALRGLEVELNSDVRHPLMQAIPLPYPLNVGRLRAGNWPSTVPDELVFEGRVGVPVGTAPGEVRRRLEDAVRSGIDADAPPVTIAWTGGQFDAAETDVDDRLVHELSTCVSAVTGAPGQLAGASYGSDMRLYCAAGIPTVLFGPGQIDQAHANDESVEIESVVRHARVIARLCATFGGG